MPMPKEDAIGLGVGAFVGGVVLLAAMAIAYWPGLLEWPAEGGTVQDHASLNYAVAAALTAGLLSLGSGFLAAGLVRHADDRRDQK